MIQADRQKSIGVQERRPLTEAEQNAIWSAVCAKIDFDWDKDPNEVIKDRYDGNKEAWCWVMVEWHNLWHLLSN